MFMIFHNAYHIEHHQLGVYPQNLFNDGYLHILLTKKCRANLHRDITTGTRSIFKARVISLIWDEM